MKAKINELTKQKEEADDDAKRARTSTSLTLTSPIQTHEETGTNTEARMKGLTEILEGLASII